MFLIHTSRAHAKTVVCCIFLLIALVLPRIVHGGCGPDDHPNIILIVADDLGWTDLPYFSTPIKWQSLPPQSTSEYQRMSPHLNRLAARMFADSGGNYGQFSPRPLLPGMPAPAPYVVLPFDVKLDASLTPVPYPTPPPAGNRGACDQYPTPGCDPQVDVLRGFGGLRQLADNGIRFDRYYASAGLCAPTRASIITGRHAPRHGVVRNSDNLPTDEVTIAEYLKQGCRDVRKDCGDGGGEDCECFLGEGNCNSLPCYTTGLIGKWHMQSLNKQEEMPWRQGFDEFIGYYRPQFRPFNYKNLFCSPPKRDGGCGTGLYVGPSSAPAPPVPQEMCCAGDNKLKFHQGSFAVPSKPENQKNCGDDSAPARQAQVGANHPGCQFSTRVFRDLAKSFISRHHDEHIGDQRKPFFLMLSVNAIHNKVDAPERTKGHYAAARTDPKQEVWAAIEELDAAVGEVVGAVKDAGIQDDTVVLFTSDQGSDHGDKFGDPMLRGGKWKVYERGIRVGIVGSACGLGHTPPTPGMDTSGQLASDVDLFPTIADAAGVPIPATRVLKACATTGKACDDLAPMPHPCDGGDSCKDHYIDGVSFRPLLLAPAAATPTPARDFVYAREQSKVQMAIASREGVIPSPTPGAKVCAYADFNQFNVPVRGASCKDCSNPDDHVDCGAQPCAVLGKVCVSPTVLAGHCLSQALCNSDLSCGTQGTCIYPPPPGGFTKCVADTDCASPKVCRVVHTLCNSCVPTAWKLWQKFNANTYSLYDLTSNPEEDDDAECHAEFSVIGGMLKTRLNAWDKCSGSDSCETQACEPQKLADQVPSCP